MKPIILFRESLVEKEEIEAASLYFDVYKYHSDIPEGSLVFGRYSVLPFYEWVEEDLNHKACLLVNTYKQHKYIANFEYYNDLEDLTFKTWFAPSDLREADAPFVIKGKTNSRKSDWNGCMFAKTAKDAIRQGCDLQQDSLIGQQDIIYRKYVPLETYEIGVNGLPFTNEWRVFVYKDSILSYAYYWSNAERADEINIAGPQEGFLEFANKVIDRMKYKLEFYVIDIARTADKEWILVEINDAQMSGLSMNNPNVLYSNLRMAYYNHHGFNN
jgi:hypothetical protein